MLDFRQLFESAPGSYLVLDPRFTIVAASDAYLESTMTKRDEILGRVVFDVFPENPDDSGATGEGNARASFGRVLRDGKPDAMAVQRHDIRRPESEGGGFEVRYWSPVNTPVFGEDGGVTYILHHVEDVTGFVRLKEIEADQHRLTDELRGRTARMEADIILRSGELQEANRKLRLVLDAAGDAFVGMDATGRITDWNRQSEATFGWSREEALGRSLADTIIPPLHRQAHWKGLERFLATGEPHILNQRIELTAIDRHGREFPVELTVWAVDDGTDTISFHAFVHDISERRAHQDALRDSEARHRHLADQLAAAQQIGGIGSWDWDVAADRVTWSDELCRIYGVEPGADSATYADYLSRVHPDDRAMVDSAVQHAFATGQSFGFDHRIVLADGSLRILRCRGSVALGDGGIPVRMTGTAQDVTDGEMVAEALRRSESRLAEAQSSARLGSWEWDIAADRVTWSDELCHLFGVATDFVATYESYLDRLHPDDRALAEAAVEAGFESGEEFAFDHRVVRPDGTVVWLHGQGRVEVGADGMPARMHGTAADITERVALQQELAALALFDELTGLHNRRGFVTVADHQLKVAARSGRSVPLLFVDMDGMKTINDTFGHIEGDRALVETAEFLRSTLRASDVVARVGGDEFCILMIDDGSDAVSVDRVVAGLHSGPPRGDRAYPLALSVGVARLEPGSATSIEELMSRADGAMYEDKASQRRLSRVLVVDDDPNLRRLAELSLRNTYDVVTAATGKAALEEAAGHVPDLVLLDLGLPDMHGTEVLRRMRSLPGGDRLSVIVMTAAAGRATELESLQGGVDDFLAKPVDLDILEARMRNVLTRSSSRSRRLGSLPASR